jgi:hypothetical protein
MKLLQVERLFFTLDEALNVVFVAHQNENSNCGA